MQKAKPGSELPDFRDLMRGQYTYLHEPLRIRNEGKFDAQQTYQR